MNTTTKSTYSNIANAFGSKPNAPTHKRNITPNITITLTMYKYNLSDEIQRLLKMSQFAPNVPKISNYKPYINHTSSRPHFRIKNHGKQSLIKKFYIAALSISSIIVPQINQNEKQ